MSPVIPEGLDLLTQHETGAVLRVLGDPDAITTALTSAGWSVLRLDRPEDAEAFYLGLGELLDRPFGHNLDALWDALSELERPTALIWVGWPEFASTHPKSTRRLLDVLTQRAEDGRPAFAALLL